MTDYTAVITGGSRGIGRAIVEAMLARGWRVISIARSAGDLVHDRLEQLAADLTDPVATACVADAIASRHEVTHFLHNAGIIRPALLEHARPEDLEALTRLHLSAALILAQAFLPAMKRRRFGRIVFCGSRAALGARTRTAYAATKAGIIGMARSWALELAPHGITVNVVAPGPIATDQLWELFPKGSAEEAELARRIPMGRLGTPEEVAHAFMYFADPEASFVTGQTLYVCGGASVGGAIL